MGDFTHSLKWSRSLDYFDSACVPGAAVDCGAALQDACDAIAAGELGELVGFGNYFIETPVVMPDPSLFRMRALGAAGAQRGPGAWNFNVVGGIVGLTLGENANTDDWRGPVLDNVSFIDDTPGTATGGLKLIRCNTWQMNKPYFGEFSAGFGLLLDGGSSSCQYGTLINPQSDRCQVGLQFRGQVEDITIVNGRFDGDDSDETPASYGIAPHADGGYGRWAILSLSVHHHLVGADFTGLRRSWINMAAENHAPLAAFGTGAIIAGIEEGDTLQRGWGNRIVLSSYRHATGLLVGTHAIDTKYDVDDGNGTSTTRVTNNGTAPGYFTRSTNW